MIKLLRGQTEEVENDGVKLSMKVISSAQQARLMDLSGDRSVEGDMKVVTYYLRNCIESIEIGGKEYDTNVLIECADLSDESTVKTMLNIRKMCDGLAFVGVEQVKKPKV